MAFDFYRKYHFPHSPKNNWEAMQIVKKAEHEGNLNDFFDRDWLKIIEDSGWGKGFKKQLLGE